MRNGAGRRNHVVLRVGAVAMAPALVAAWTLLAATTACGGALPSTRTAPAPGGGTPSGRPAGRGGGYTAEEAEGLAVRAAQADGLRRLADLVLSTPTADGRTLREVLGPGSPKEAALRVFLRSARMVGSPRLYSDGVAEVDVQVPLDTLQERVRALAGEALDPAALRSCAVEGVVGVCGQGRAPEDLPREVVAWVLAAGPTEVPEMFPLGWERVSARGRVLAARMARIDAYRRMADRLRDLSLGSTGTVADLVTGTPAAEAAFDAFVRGLPVAGPPRLMPDGVAEVTVEARVRDLIALLKEVRRLRPDGRRWSEETLDRLSVQVKADHLEVVGWGMPPPETIRQTGRAVRPAGAPRLEWADGVLEARGTAGVSPDIEDGQRARLLAARSAKGRAMEALRRQVDTLALEDGATVAERASRDPRFRRDLETFLESARMTACRPVEDGRAWEVVLRLPLRRLYECLLAAEASDTAATQ